MAEAKRTQVKKKVAAGQARNQDRGRTTIVDRAGERAIEAKDKFTEFAKEHPIATVAGGVAVGVLIAALFKGPRQAAVRGGSKAAGLAAIGAELALAYAQQAMEVASEAGKAGAKRLDGLGDSARDAGRDAADRASDVGETALAATREAGKRLGRAIRDRIN
jgi:hypothetical protein